MQYIFFDAIESKAFQNYSTAMHYALGNVIIRNQKSPKVKHYCAFIFHRKSFKPFLDDAKLLKCLYKYSFGQIFWTFVHLFAKNMKGWSYKLEIW